MKNILYFILAAIALVVLYNLFTFDCQRVNGYYFFNNPAGNLVCFTHVDRVDFNCVDSDDLEHFLKTHRKETIKK